MNILFITTSHNPFHPTQGASQRSSLLLQACCAIANVDVISFCTDNEDSTDNYNIIYQSKLPTINDDNRYSKLKKLLTPWKPETVYNVDLIKKRIIDAYVSKKYYDYIVIRYVPEAIICGLLQYNSRLVVDVDDHPVDSIYRDIQFVRSKLNKIYHNIYAISVQIAFNIVLHRIKIALFTNAHQVKTNNSVYLPNIPYYKLDTYDATNRVVAQRLLFVGDICYPPNIHGIKHFLQKIYPIVKQEIPDVTLHIVGNINNKLKQEFENISGVSAMGFVPNLLKEYEECCITVVPIYYGAGTCIKVLESMQLGRACVTTPVGFRGYDSIFVPNEDILVAKDDVEYIKSIILLLLDKTKRDSISFAAKYKQKEFYSREKFFNIVKNTLE